MIVVEKFVQNMLKLFTSVSFSLIFLSSEDITFRFNSWFVAWFESYLHEVLFLRNSPNDS